MKKALQVVNRVVFILSFLVNIILVFQIFARISGWNIDYFFNSDSLYLASIYKDIFEDKTGLEGWNLNLAPNFIPEWPVYFLIRFLSADFRIADVLYSVYSVVIINLLTYGIFSKIFRKTTISYLTLANLGYTIFLFFYIFHRDFVNTSYLFLTGFHGGAFILSLLSFFLFFSYLRSGKSAYLIILFFTVLTGIISDRLLLTLFVVPSLTSLFFISNVKMRKALVLGSVVTIVAAILGFIGFSLLKNSNYIHIVGMGYRATDLSKSIPAFFNYLKIIKTLANSGGIKLLMVTLSLISLALGLALSFSYVILRKNTLTNQTLEKILVTVFTTQIIVVTLTPILNGTFYNIAHLRYNIYAFYIALSLLVLLIFLFTRNKKKLQYAVDGMAIILLVFVLFTINANESKKTTIKGVQRIFTYYPEKVAIIDSLTHAHKIQYGVGSYWNAKFVTLFSKNDVRMYCVHYNLRPWYHVTNKHWYFRDGKGKYGMPGFSFILLNDLKLKVADTEILGDKMDTIVTENISLLIVQEFGYTKDKQLFILPENSK